MNSVLLTVALSYMLKHQFYNVFQTEHVVLKIFLLKWLTLVVSGLCLLGFSFNSLACDKPELIKLNAHLQNSVDLESFKNAFRRCGNKPNSYEYEVSRRVNRLYIGGKDTELVKYRIASLVSIYNATKDKSFLDNLKRDFFSTQHGYLEFCLIVDLNSNEGCSIDRVRKMSIDGLAHASYLLSFYIDSDSEIVRLRESAAVQNHVDAKALNVTSLLWSNSSHDEKLKSELINLAASGDSIDAEIYLLKSLLYGLEPFNKNPNLVVELASSYLEYRDLPEYDFLLSLGYYDINDEKNFMKYLNIAADSGFPEAVEFRNSGNK
ncbi:hypothetical protein L9G16_17965 [Shewanella sp. A25]|nr:hypothetical protein [Shewanella shenzhenensis]